MTFEVLFVVLLKMGRGGVGLQGRGIIINDLSFFLALSFFWRGGGRGFREMFGEMGLLHRFKRGGREIRKKQKNRSR